MLLPAELLPLGDRLKVLPLKPPIVTKGGILMPESSQARDKPLSGLVLAIGRGRQLESGTVVPLECAEGDIVHFSKYAGVTVYDDAVGHEVLLIREDEALSRQRADDILVVTHNGAAGHVPGDPRCELCGGAR
jgi:chaperonin GroES